MRFTAGKSLYVEMKDLVFIGNLPNYVISEMKVNSDYKGLEEFKNDDSKMYFESRPEVINYDEIDSLSEEEIYDLIHSLYEEYFRLYGSTEIFPNSIKNNVMEFIKITFNDYPDLGSTL